MTKQTFIKGAMILLAAGIINRILGFIPRITLPRIIGAEGVGIYQLSYPFLIVMITLVTGGIPLAIAKWIADAKTKGDEKAVKTIYRLAMTITLVASISLTALMLIGAPYITANIIPDKRVFESFLVMSPMIIIVGISSVYRGYFQGLQNMIPSAISQTLETIVRTIFSLLLAYLMLPYGLSFGAAGAMAGVVIGEVVSLFYMYVSFRRQQRLDSASSTTNLSTGVESLQPPVESKSYIKKILGVAIPVTGSRLVGSLAYLLESIFTARSLAVAGIATGIATAQYGALQGMILPLILLPTALTYSLSVSLVPSLSEAAAQKQQELIHKRLHQTIKITLVAGVPVTMLMFVFAVPICHLLYAHGEYGEYLKILAPIGIFIYLQGPLQATLQALNKPGVALFNTLIGAVIKLILIVTLASMPMLGIKGAIIAIGINTVLVTFLHAIAVRRFIKFKWNYLDIVKVLTVTIIAGAFALFAWNQLSAAPSWAQLFMAGLAMLTVYIFLLFKTKLIDKDDFIRLPYINKWFTS